MDPNTTDSQISTPDSDDSSYLTSDGALDFGSLFSDRFVNRVSIHSSSGAPTELYSATRYGKRFVLKGLKNNRRADPIQNMALAKEFEIGLSLDHPNIRRTVGLEDVEGLGKVIVLEYIDGVTLDSFIASGKLTRTLARTIAAQIASALSYMHGKQVLHRDLKPSNIIVQHHGAAVKLIDFNLSDSNSFVILKAPAGTKRYIAPEQLLPDACPTVAADIYSFGVVVGELASATGDAALAEVADRCMEPDPSRRPTMVADVGLPSARPSFGEHISNLLASKILTAILVGACVILTAIIVRTLLFT